MRTIVSLALFLAILSCDNEVSVNSPLDNSSWKVFKTSHEYLDGTSKSFTNDIDGGFYITFNKNSEFEQTWYPYSATGKGTWNYLLAEKKLRLLDSDDKPIIEYNIVTLTKDNLTLYADSFLYNKDGFVKVTIELIPF